MVVAGRARRRCGVVATALMGSRLGWRRRRVVFRAGVTQVARVLGAYPEEGKGES